MNDITLTLEDAASRIRSGQIVAFPTETFFGLAADPFSETAVKRLLELKGRPLGEGIPLLVDSSERVDMLLANETAQQRALRQRLQAAFWPGPLTLIVQPNADAAKDFIRGIPAADGSIALRLSSHIPATALANAVGGLLSATSANPRGELPAAEESLVRRYFPELAVLAGSCGAEQNKLPSTIVDVRGEQLKIVRVGCISEEELALF